MVPLLDLTPQNAALHSELMLAFERVLRSGQFILGPDVAAFEEEVADKIGAHHAIGVSSGTDAISLALMALEIGPGDEVICPSYTFFATAGCIARTGAKPIFADACPICFNIDVQDAERKISSKTKAIIPVHLFGQMADMDAVMSLADAHDLAVIEDAAQSLGASHLGRSAGTIGTFGTFSFFPSKNLGAFGDAGMLVTNDDALAEKARILRVHGSKPKYYHKFVGANFRIDTVQAALLRVKLPRYDSYTAGRRANATFYLDQLSKIPGAILPTAEQCACADPATGAGDEPRIILPAVHPHQEPIWNQFTLRVIGEGKRDTLRARLTEQGIGTEIYYPVPLHQQECFASLSPKALPIAERLAREALSIPIYPELSDAQKQEVVRALETAVSERHWRS